MKTSFKNVRLNNEFHRRNDIKLSWKISLDYSKILYSNLNKRDVLLTVDNVYNQYIQSLRSNGLMNLKNKNNYLDVWETLVNTCRKEHYSESFKKFCIKQLYYTSLLHNR